MNAIACPPYPTTCSGTPKSGKAIRDSTKNVDIIFLAPSFKTTSVKPLTAGVSLPVTHLLPCRRCPRSGNDSWAEGRLCSGERLKARSVTTGPSALLIRGYLRAGDRASLQVRFKMQDVEEVLVWGYVWLLWDVFKLLIAFSPLLVIAAIFIMNTESGACKNHKPDFELEPAE